MGGGVSDKLYEIEDVRNVNIVCQNDEIRE